MESRFLEEKRRNGETIHFELRDGRSVRGTVAAHDGEHVEIAGESGPLVIRKSEIRFLAEDG